MTEKIFRMKKGGQGPRGILGRIPFREKTCQCPKARCRTVAGQGGARRGSVADAGVFVFARDGGEGVSPQEGEAHGEETGEALRREQFVPHRWQAQRISERPCRGAGVLPLRGREVGVVACALHRVAKP